MNTISFNNLRRFRLLRAHKKLQINFVKLQSFSTTIEEKNFKLESDSHVEELVNHVCKLNVMEMSHFVNSLKTKLKIPDSALNSPPVSLAQPVSADKSKKVEGTGEEDDTKSYTLKLKGFEPAKKIGVIKVVRSLFSLGLKESKNLVDSAPCTLKGDLQKEEGTKFMEELKKAGAKLELV
ncbi:hypothetical protein MHBO_002009 [Bonamia ostreae]|uniref:Large ribosomal subunit protein bL12 C-terminal domain-containing protein n=1 Tax=Bonamia ostreae TaxID=126728 RepID=A0ABV2AKY0_9EUKA